MCKENEHFYSGDDEEGTTSGGVSFHSSAQTIPDAVLRFHCIFVPQLLTHHEQRELRYFGMDN